MMLISSKTVKMTTKRIILILMVLGFTALCSAQFGGGSGSVADPWQIATVEHLNNIREQRNGHFIQTAHINLGVAPWNEGAGWLPIGILNGSFNGNSFRILNLTINRPDTNEVGLFSEYFGNISNLSLEDVQISGNNYVGAIWGGRYGSGLISNSYVTGNITGNNYVGGLVGYLGNGRIINCYSNAHVHSRDSSFGYIGGLAGAHEIFGNDIIENCYVSGPVTADGAVMYIGPVIGKVYVFPEDPTPIRNSYWNIDTVGLETCSGGAEGKSTAEMIRRATFIDWDFVNAWSIIEGETYPYLRMQTEPAGHNYPLLPPINVTGYVGGDACVILIWDEPIFNEPTGYRIYRNSILMSEVNGDVFQYIDNEVDNLSTYRYNLTALYGERESISSMVAIVTPVPGGYAGGMGTSEAPYLIATSQQMDYIRYNLNVFYMQTADIDLSEIENWQPIGSRTGRPFSGSLDGNGYLIRNMTINLPETDYVGLIGYYNPGREGMILQNIVLEEVEVIGNKYVGGLAGEISSFAVIEGCGVNGSITAHSIIGGLVGNNKGKISGSYSTGSVESSVDGLAGGLVAYNYYGEIDNCWSTSNVSGQNTIAGLVAYFIGSVIENQPYGIINNSYAAGNVQGHNLIGGFVGYNSIGRITNCYARGIVTGTDDSIGGFIGINSSGTIINSYSTSRVSANAGAENIGGFAGRSEAGWGLGRVTNCYWDTYNSGQNQSAAGFPRTTAQMTYPHSQDTYVGWDFDSIWGNDREYIINDGYPYLFFQLEVNPYPLAATHPTPEDESEDISLDISRLYWDYNSNIFHTNPAGFRVYLNKTGEFNEEDPFVWVPYVLNVITYSCSEILPEQMEGNTTYFWKVVPTTSVPDMRKTDNMIDNGKWQHLPLQRSNAGSREDAIDVPIWRFHTIDTTDIEDFNILPYRTELNKNYPNPFNPETTIRFSLAETSDVTIEIFNVNGQKVFTLINERIAAGIHNVSWDGKNEQRAPVSSGIYLYRMRTGSFSQTRSMILIK